MIVSEDMERRLATLEAQRVADYHAMKELKTDVHTIGVDVRAIKETVVRSRGFLAGATFVVATIWTAVIGLVMYFWERIA